MVQVLFFTTLGFLSSASLYFQHERCESFNWNPNSDGTCGYDFYENERVVKEAKGLYSTDLFVQRSVEIIKNHSLNNPTKVMKTDIIRKSTTLFENPQRFFNFA